MGVPFPSTVVRDLPAFERYLDAMQPVLDDRFSRELSLAGTGSDFWMEGFNPILPGPTRFRVSFKGSELLYDGRQLPNWRETLTCERSALNSRERALAHLLDAKGRLASKAAVGLVGDAGSVGSWIERRTGSLETVSAAIGRLKAEDGSLDLVLGAEAFQIADPRALCAEAARALRPGGMFVFTTPFHHRQPSTTRGPEGVRIGWDIMDIPKSVGLNEVEAHLYWDETLGYLGACNFIFAARRP